MQLNQQFISELQHELESTRKILNVLPEDMLTWKPHEKSMTLGRLAAHVSELVGWITMTLKTDELDFSKIDYKPLVPTTVQEIKDVLEKCAVEAIAALETAAPEDFGKIWTLRRGEHIILALPKSATIRSMAMNHLYHHRGQLTVYLRILDVPVPGMYGPSADERN